MDFPVTLKEGHPEAESLDRMIWVDTVYVEADAKAHAVCITKFGQVKTFKISEIYVCEDAKPRILLDPEKLQAALRQRLGTDQVMMPGAGGMQLGNVNVQRIPGNQAGQMGYNFPGPGAPPPTENNDDDQTT